MASKLPIFQDDSSSDLIRTGLSELQTATQLLRRYKVRTPQRVAAVYLSLATVADLLNGDRGALVDGIEASEQASDIAAEYDLPDFRLQSETTIALLMGRIAALDQDVTLYCNSVKRYYAAARFHGRRSGFRLEFPERDELDTILIQYREKYSRSYKACLTSVGADVDRINRDLDNKTASNKAAKP